MEEFQNRIITSIIEAKAYRVVTIEVQNLHRQLFMATIIAPVPVVL